MSRVFWPLFAVSVVFSVLVFAALPFGPDLIYGLAAVSQLGMMVLLARSCSRLSERVELPPPNHPVWRNPQV